MPKPFSTDKDINKLLRQLVREKGFMLSRIGRHNILISPSGRRLIVSATPSDSRAMANLKADLKRIEREDVQELPRAV